MHLYAHELMRPRVARRAAASAAEVLKQLPQDRVVCALVDDYNSTLIGDREEAAETVIWFGEQADFSIDFVGFESDCAKEADRLLAQSGVEDGWMRQNGKHHSSAVKVRDEDYIACPALAAVWSLARLGQPPYTMSFDLYAWGGRVGLDGHDSFVAQRLVTVLPVMYMRTEVTAYDLLKGSGNDVQGRIGYAFY